MNTKSAAIVLPRLQSKHSNGLHLPTTDKKVAIASGNAQIREGSDAAAE